MTNLPSRIKTIRTGIIDNSLEGKEGNLHWKRLLSQLSLGTIFCEENKEKAQVIKVITGTRNKAKYFLLIVLSA